MGHSGIDGTITKGFFVSQLAGKRARERYGGSERENYGNGERAKERKRVIKKQEDGKKERNKQTNKQRHKQTNKLDVIYHVNAVFNSCPRCREGCPNVVALLSRWREWRY